MSGGHATTAGVRFQCEVGAWFAAHILAAQPISQLGPALPELLELEALSPVDDIVVHCKSGGVWYVNVKTEVTLSPSSKSQLSSVADQFVRQWLEGVSSASARRLDPGIDRLVLVVKPARSGPLVSGLTPVIRRVTDRAPTDAEAQIAYTDGEKNALDVFGAQIGFHWKNHKGTPPDRDELLALLSCVRLIEFDLSGATRAAVGAMLTNVVEPEQVEGAIDALIDGCLDFARHRSGGDTGTLRSLLGAKRIRLRHRPDFQEDINRLQASTDVALADMSRYAAIHVRATDTTIRLARACTDAVVSAALGGTSFLVIGEPGSGKSGALHAAALAVRDANKSVLMIQVDQLTGTSLEEIRQELMLANPLLDALAEWRPEAGGVLMIDALDASRGTGAEPAIRSLISEVRRRAPQWTIVASIRKFDLRYGSQYQRLFEGRPVDSKFSDSEFGHVRHLNVPRLTDAEVSRVRSEWPALDKIASRSGDEFKALLDSPFNLYLLGRILEREPDGANTARTQLDLLAQFWQRRVQRDEFVSSEEAAFVLSGLLRRMLERRRLSASNSDVPQTHMRALERLLRDGVLYQPHESRSVSFAHHVLFDFALAKLVFLRDEAKFIDDELVQATDDVLLVAPAIMLALRTIWERGASRDPFWAVSLALAGDSRLGSFVRALPARVAAEAIRAPEDVAPLIEALANSKSNETGTLLTQHLLSVVLAGVVRDVPRIGGPDDPWCEILELAAEASIRTLQWPINAALNAWSEAAPLTESERRSLGRAARRLLAEQLKPGAPYHDGSMASAVKAVVRTYSSSSADSENLIRALLENARVRERGHKELFWLATEFRELAQSNSALAADFLVTAFSAPLPSADEKTSIGNSRILSLTSSKRQDFEGVLHQLEEQIPWFLAHEPAEGGGALRKLLTARIEADKPLEQYGRTGQAQLRGRAIKFREDHSCIWWSPRTDYYDANAKLVEALCSTLRKAQEADFETYFDVLLVGDIPAAIVTAFLRAAIERPNPGSALGLVLSRDVLSMIDTSYDSAQLLSTHYPRLTPAEKARLQDVIASVEDERRQRVLVGAIPDDEPLTNDVLRAVKGTLGVAPPKNEPHFSMGGGWVSSDDHSWLREQGVDTGSPSNSALLDAANSLKARDLPAGDLAALGKLQPLWTGALDALELLDSHSAVHQMVRNTVCDAVADLAQAICDRAQEEGHLTGFPKIREVVSRCLSDDLDPLPVRNEEREEEFARSASWGSPAARIPASAALMAYVRAIGRATERDRNQILALARDPAVEVRHTVLARANLPCVAAPDLSRELAVIAFTEEKNEGVLSFFLGAFDNYIGNHLSWAPTHLLALDAGVDAGAERHRGDMQSILVRLILRLWVAWGITEAKERLQLWVASPLKYQSRVDALLTHLRGLVAYGEADTPNPRDDGVRGKCLQLYSTLVHNLAGAHRDLMSRAHDGEDVRQELTDATRLLDSSADHLYFGSGAYARTHSEREAAIATGAGERRRFIHEYLPSLTKLARIPYPSVTHPVLQIIEALVSDGPEEMLQLFFEAVREGGRTGGYQFESLGADLVVKIARKFLADYSGLIASQSEYRVGLVEVLNLFAETGWPEARKLVYQLPEMLR